MLDQNTDRMWYVIGAIVIGAAIIAMGLNIFSESFDSVDGMMSSLTGIANEKVFSISGGIYTEEEIDNLVNNEDYIPVATAEELDNIRKGETLTYGAGSKWESEYTSGLDKKFIQVANIDLSGIKNWMPIGGLGYSFTGSFDGGGYIIRNLKLVRGNYAGLFGHTANATLNHFGLVNADVQGSTWVGGLVGFPDDSTITDSYATGVVSGRSAVGGLIGSLRSTILTRSYANVEVYGSGFDIGGLVGQGYRSSEINGSYSLGNVLGEVRYVGGLVGYLSESSIINSYALGSSELTGLNELTGPSDIGVGGLVGGLQVNSAIRNSYALGLVSGNNGYGGLVGINYSLNVENSYYNKETTNQSDVGKGIGLISSEMKQQSTYDGWDFDNIWQMQEGQYPTLR